MLEMPVKSERVTGVYLFNFEELAIDHVSLELVPIAALVAHRLLDSSTRFS